MAELFRHAREVGKQFGVMTVIQDGVPTASSSLTRRSVTSRAEALVLCAVRSDKAVEDERASGVHVEELRR